MESSNQFHQIFTSVATQLPSLLTMLGGIVMAIIRWKRHPRVSLTLVIALGLIILHVLVFAVVYAVLPTLVGAGDFTMLQMALTFMSVAYNFTLAIFTIILLVAVFMQRGQQQPPPLYEQVAEARAA